MKVRHKKDHYAGPTAETPEGVFGVCDEPQPQTPAREKREFKLGSKSSFRRPSLSSVDVAPSINIKDDPTPDLVKKVGPENIQNAVVVPKERLLEVVRKAKRQASVLSDLMLDSAIHTLGLDSATSYTQAAVKDGLGIELESDSSLEIIYSDLALLELTIARVRKMRVPRQVKRYYLKVFIDKMTEATASKISAAQSKANAERNLNNMRGFIQSLSDRKQQVKDKLDRNAPDRVEIAEHKPKGNGRAAVRRKTKG